MLDAARRMLAGERLYTDLIDLNPPFVFWLSEAAVLAGRLGFDPADVFRVIVIAILLGMLALAWPLTRDAKAIRAAFVLFAFALPLGHFGEREHLIFGLMLGYVVMGADGADEADEADGVGVGVGVGWRIAVGVAAGVGMAIKPPVGLVAVVLTLYLCVRGRSLRPVLRVENLAALGTLAAAFVAILVFEPAYLQAVQAYGGLYAEFSRGTPRQLLFRDIYPLSVWLALVVAAVTVASVAASRRVIALALASAAFLGAAVAQGKGFGYHYFPAMGYAVVTLFVLAAADVLPARRRSGMIRRVLAVTALVLVLALPALVAVERFAGKAGDDVVERRALSEALDDLGPGSRVAIVSVRLADAYPILLERRWEHVLSMPHVWFTGLGDEGRGKDVEAALWRRVGENLREGAPEAIVIRAPAPAERTRGDVAADYLEYLCADETARAALAQYGKAAHASGYDIYRPRQSGAGACASS
ncbi:MAG TPA: hypothetical protein VF037_07655 [Gemmatimonadales bacterium]